MIYKNPLAEYKTPSEKQKMFLQDCKKGDVQAYKSNRTSLPLKDMNIAEVEFIGGLWRVQDDFKYDITFVRDRDMVLGQQLPLREKNRFVYYKSAIVGYNCYGPFIMNFDTIVSKYSNANGTYWGYGKNISEARAFLGIKLMDIKEKQK